jgi:hypothetical protein
MTAMRVQQIFVPGTFDRQRLIVREGPGRFGRIVGHSYKARIDPQ